jgi:hypothetical protein
MPGVKKLPEIDLKEMEEHKHWIMQEREEFHMYVEWLQAGNERGERDYRDTIRELKLSKSRRSG